jgi:ATP-dependent protease HslVU (ClpYQ) peptidase subunit
VTCIVGLREGGSAWIGGDSAGVSGWDVTVRTDSKVFVNGPYAVGFTWSYRMGQLLQYKAKLPEPPKQAKDLHGFMVREFVEAVRDCLKAGGMATRDKEAEQGGTFMVGVHGRVFVVESDYQVIERAEPFAAVGSGAAYALGSLATSRGKASARLEQALTTAERFCGAVRGPFKIVASPA